MDIALFKIFSIVLIFALGMVGGILPMRIKPTASGLRKLVLGNAFSGGIFLGAGLLHMLPDAVENLQNVYGNVDYPYGMLFCGVGFLLILLLEKGIVGGDENVAEASQGKNVSAYVLLLVLSVHSIIAGSTLGMEGSGLSSLAILIAILAHKGAAAFALGISFKKAGFSRRKHYKSIALFSSTTPSGVVLGLILVSVLTTETNYMFEALFDGLAAGTFLYVAIADIMAEVFEDPENQWMKVGLTVLGFGIMGVVAIWT